MRVHAYVYDSADPAPHVQQVLDLLEDREETIDYVDVDEPTNRDDGRREAMLTVKNAVGIGTPPDELYGEDGSPDLTVGALVTEAPTGRRSLHVGADALDALETEG